MNSLSSLLMYCLLVSLEFVHQEVFSIQNHTSNLCTKLLYTTIVYALDGCDVVWKSQR